MSGLIIADISYKLKISYRLGPTAVDFLAVSATKLLDLDLHTSMAWSKKFIMNFLYLLLLVGMVKPTAAVPRRKDLGPRDHLATMNSLCVLCGRKGSSIGLQNITPPLEILGRLK